MAMDHSGNGDTPHFLAKGAGLALPSKWPVFELGGRERPFTENKTYTTPSGIPIMFKHA